MALGLVGVVGCGGPGHSSGVENETAGAIGRLVSQQGVEVITRTPELPEFEFGLMARPGIVEL